jgi:hypothetical protein
VKVSYYIWDGDWDGTGELTKLSTQSSTLHSSGAVFWYPAAQDFPSIQFVLMQVRKDQTQQGGRGPAKLGEVTPSLMDLEVVRMIQWAGLSEDIQNSGSGLYND